MTARAAYLKLVGPRLMHITAASNLAAIEREGLMPAAELARRDGLSPRQVVLRHERMVLPSGAILTHQLPILQHLHSAVAVLDGHTPESWAAQLDTRVFFWTERHGRAFRASIDRELPTQVLWLDAAGLFDALSDQIDLSPANSGNFRQGGARMPRGDWLYVPATQAHDFPANRMERGLVKSADKVKEVSLRGHLSAELLARIRL